MISIEAALERLKDKASWLDQSTYIGWKNKAKFIDPQYGEWWTLPKYIYEGHGHPKRGIAERVSQSISLEETLLRLSDRASWLDQSTFISISGKATFNHPEFGPWITNISTVIAGHDHPKVGKRNAMALSKSRYGLAVNYEKKAVDIVGQTFGKITVISQISSKPVKWLGRCECGQEKEFTTNAIKRASSCGCQLKETLHNKNTLYNQSFVGKNYSKWTIIDITKRPTYLLCQCECGTVREVYRNSLIDGVSTNCGCSVPIHKTEERCRAIIEQLSQYKWPKKRLFKNPATDAYLELDGYCIELNAAFEYDGEQHFKECSFGSHSENLSKRQQMDHLKDNLCLQYGVTLIRIPYFEKNNLNQFILNSLQKAGL